MKKLNKFRWFVAAGIGFLAVCCVWVSTGRMRGVAQAKLDLAAGHYRVLTYGLHAPWRQKQAHDLRQRFGVEFRSVGGCIVSSSVSEFVQGYDSVSIVAIDRKFGRDVMRESSEQAAQEWKRTALLDEGETARN